MSAPLPTNEAQRLAKLSSYNILDTESETAYDDITHLVTQLLNVPIALVSLVDRDRQWFKSSQGLGVCQTNRDQAFCAHAILQPEVMVVPDATQDPRFADNPLVTGAPHIRFYAGAPLITPDGFALGTVCAIDTQPRTLSEDQQQSLQALSRLVVNQLELRQNLSQLAQESAQRTEAEAKLQQREQRFSQLVSKVPGMLFQFRLTPDGQASFPYVNGRCQEIYGGLTQAEIMADANTVIDLVVPEYLPGFQQAMIDSAQSLGTFDWTGPIIDLQGREKWLQIQSTPELQDDGSILWHGILLDDTEQRQLQLERDRLQAILEATPDVIGMADAQGRSIYLNQAGQEMLAIPPERTKGFHITQVLSPAFARKFESEVIPATIRDGVWSGEGHLLNRYGEEIPVSQVLVAHKNEHGGTEYFSTILRDIRERKQIEEQVRASQQFLQFILDALPQGVVWKDRDLRLQGCNQKIAEMLGFSSPQELVGKTDYDLPFAREEADWYRSCDRQVIESGQADLGIIEPQTVGGQTKWLNTNKLPLKTSSNKIEGILVTIEDITQLKQAQQQLKEQADRERLLNQINLQLRKTLDFETILSTTLENLRSYLHIDRCTFTLHYTDGDDSPYWLILGDAHRADLPNLDSTTISASSLSSINQQLLSLKGDRIADVATLPESPLQSLLAASNTRAFLSVPFQRTSGQIGVLNCWQYGRPRTWQTEEIEILEDVLEQLDIALTQAELYDQSQTKAEELQQALQTLQRTQAQMVQTEKMSSLGQLVAGVAHEINNPMGFIYTNLNHAQNYTQDLLDLIDSYQAHSSALPANVLAQIAAQIEAIDLDFLRADLPNLFGSMKNGANRVKTIVESLRTFSRLDEAALKDIDIHQGLESTLTILENRLWGKDMPKAIAVVKAYDQLPKVECYAGQINQVLMHILNNAIDALQNSTQPNPEIHIQTQLLNAEQVEIAIADNGPGISADIRDRIFDPFFTTKPVGKGTGMGLSTSYQIITDTHGGNLICESAIGQGSTFRIQLPVRLSLEQPRRGKSSDRHPERSHPVPVGKF
ncbi:MAG: PAS domain S-box protein [Cyanobacteria bacterium P01_A01_bin.123]